MIDKFFSTIEDLFFSDKAEQKIVVFAKWSIAFSVIYVLGNLVLR